MKMALIIVLGILNFSFAWASSEEGHIPISLVSHGFNLLVFIGVIYWALFKKANLPESAVMRRKSVEDEIVQAREALKTAESRQQELKSKFTKVDQETSSILSAAEAQAQKMANDLRHEGQSLAKRITDEAALVADQELRRMREKLTTDIVDEAIEQASRVLQERLEGKKDEAVIKDQLNGLG